MRQNRIINKMKLPNRKTLLLVLSTLLVGLFMGWLLFRSTKEEAALHQHSTASDGVIWTCSMHPQIRQSEPGQCPICGMNLIPLENGAEGQNNPMEVRMSPTAMQLASVQTEIIRKGKAVKELRLSGKVQVDERTLSRQTSHLTGRVEKLYINTTGEFVPKGKVIAEVYSPELVTAQEELFEAQKMKDLQPALFAASKERLKNWKLTDEQINRILEAGKPKETFPILSDINGVVTNKKVQLGDYIQRGSLLFEVANLSQVWVLFDIYESDLTWVKTGDLVKYTFQALPGQKFSGRISFIDPLINPATRVAKARIVVSNLGNKLKPEMFVSGIIKSQSVGSKADLIVPKSAVMWTGDRSVVYVKSVNEQGLNFQMREVLLGPSLGSSYVVTEGLNEGEEIVTYGTFSIDAAAQLAGKPSMMNPEGGATMSGHNHGGMTAENTSANIQHSSHSKSVVIGSKAKMELKLMLDSYIKLKNALTDDNLKNAISMAKEMSTALGKVNMGVFKGEAHIIWMKHSSVLELELQKANKANEIGKMRESFKSISDQMVLLVKSFGSIDGTLYIDYCPMANNNQGAEWLSKEKDIKNPYFGASMLTCGEVRQEFN